jgi:hypothetical protein
MTHRYIMINYEIKKLSSPTNYPYIRTHRIFNITKDDPMRLDEYSV